MTSHVGRSWSERITTFLCQIIKYSTGSQKQKTETMRNVVVGCQCASYILLAMPVIIATTFFRLVMLILSIILTVVPETKTPKAVW